MTERMMVAPRLILVLLVVVAMWIAMGLAVSSTAQEPLMTPPVITVDYEYNRIIIPEAMEDWYVCREQGPDTICAEVYRIEDPYPDDIPK